VRPPRPRGAMGADCGLGPVMKYSLSSARDCVPFRSVQECIYWRVSGSEQDPCHRACGTGSVRPVGTVCWAAALPGRRCGPGPRDRAAGPTHGGWPAGSTHRAPYDDAVPRSLPRRRRDGPVSCVAGRCRGSGRGRRPS